MKFYMLVYNDNTPPLLFKTRKEAYDDVKLRELSPKDKYTISRLYVGEDLIPYVLKTDFLPKT